MTRKAEDIERDYYDQKNRYPKAHETVGFILLLELLAEIRDELNIYNKNQIKKIERKESNNGSKKNNN